MKRAPHDAFICDAVRTPFGRYTAVNQLHRSGGRYAICTMCIGVGQGISVLLEQV